MRQLEQTRSAKVATYVSAPGNSRSLRRLLLYDMPKKVNPDGAGFVDLGLGGALKAMSPDVLKALGVPAAIVDDRDALDELLAGEMGKHKTPTLRNVNLRPHPDFVKAYAHNGFFKSMKEIVHFYNTRDVESEGWPEPEFPGNLTRGIVGNLGLTGAEEDAIVAFMATLSDGYEPEP